METEMARNMLCTWAEAEPVRIYVPKTAQKTGQRKATNRRKIREWTLKTPDLNRLGKRYGILLIGAALFTIYTIILSARVEYVTEKRVRAELAETAVQAVETYKAEQARAAQAEHFLSGDASREAFINQEVDAAARLAAKMTNDTQKGGIICNALARVMNKNYPGTMREVIDQPNQWMFYDAENKFSTHDREIAEQILRAYYEDGIVPNGLTEEYVYGSWSESDYVLRNTWDFGSATRTWRYQG